MISYSLLDLFRAMSRFPKKKPMSCSGPLRSDHALIRTPQEHPILHIYLPNNNISYLNLNLIKRFVFFLSSYFFFVRMVWFPPLLRMRAWFLRESLKKLGFRFRHLYDVVLLLFLGKRKEEKTRIKTPQLISDYLQGCGRILWRSRIQASSGTCGNIDGGRRRPCSTGPRDSRDSERRSWGGWLDL
jgi:hypothetical protein